MKNLILLFFAVILCSFAPVKNCCPKKGTVISVINVSENGCTNTYNIVANGRCGTKKVLVISTCG